MADTKIWDGADWKSGDAAKVWDGTQWVPLTSGTGGGGTGWQRPADWLPLNVTPGEQKIQLLCAVFPNYGDDGRIVTVKVSGAYTVDWGDGTAPENFATSVLAKHQYAAGVLAGTETSEGWRQAVITITPQSGQTLTNIELGNSYHASKHYDVPVVDVLVGPGTINSWTFGGTFGSNVRSVEFLTPVTTAGAGFYDMPSVRRIIGNITFTGSTNFGFKNCHVLTEFPTMTATALTSLNYAFAECYLMSSIPSSVQFNTAGVTSFSSTFNKCITLGTIPPLNLSTATTLSLMFADCKNLVSIEGELDFSQVTNTGSMFSGCYGLRRLVFAAGKGPKVNTTIYGMLDPTALNAIYTSLPTVTGQTLTVSNVTGTVGDDPSIAQAKGWTVTGS